MKKSDLLLIEWTKKRLQNERISQKVFAQAGKIPGETVSRILSRRRKVTIEFISACCLVFDVSPNEVFEVMGLYQDPNQRGSGSHKLNKKDQEVISYLTLRLRKK